VTSRLRGPVVRVGTACKTPIDICRRRRGYSAGGAGGYCLGRHVGGDAESRCGAPAPALARSGQGAWDRCDLRQPSDDGVKDAQVTMMGQINRWASRVVAWLGPKDDDSDCATDCSWGRRSSCVGERIRWNRHRTPPIRVSQTPSPGCSSLLVNELTALYRICAGHGSNGCGCARRSILAAPALRPCVSRASGLFCLKPWDALGLAYDGELSARLNRFVGFIY
jgi:hypothetical protein